MVKICTECKWHRLQPVWGNYATDGTFVVERREHKCHHPSLINLVDGSISPILCELRRSLEARDSACGVSGYQWEPKDPQSPSNS